MDRFYIVANTKKTATLEQAIFIKHFLEEKGKFCEIAPEEKNTAVKADFKYTDPTKVPEGTECIIVLGGDGTLIQAAADTCSLEIPFLGINMGTLGYLTEVEAEKSCEALEELLSDHYSIESRMMLDGCVYRGGELIQKTSALNDIVLSRCGSLRIIPYEISVNDAVLTTYNADGFIAATPTGSTGYNLSAGGPIVSPKASLTVLTPICPHTLNSRSVIVSSDDVVKVKIGESRYDDQEVEVSFDGENAVTLNTGDYVEIARSEKTTRIIKIRSTSFLEVLGTKLGGKV